MFKPKVIIPFVLLILLAVITGCSAKNEEFFGASSMLLEIDKQWTDIMTYQVEYDGLLALMAPGSEDVVFTWRDSRIVDAYVSENGGILEEIKFNLNFVELPTELSGVRLVLLDIYAQESALFTFSDWKPFQNHLNAQDYLNEFGDNPEYGRTLYDQWVAVNFLAPWLGVQLKRKILYERWLSILEEQGADTAIIANFEATINKE